MSMQTISYEFGLKTSGNPQTRQITHFWYVWGQPRSVTSDDHRKVIMRCQGSHVVIALKKVYHIDKCFFFVLREGNRSTPQLTRLPHADIRIFHRVVR